MTTHFAKCRLILLFLVLFVSVTTSAAETGLVAKARNCALETARLERLACFDAVFDTPVNLASIESVRAPRRQPAQWLAAYDQESGREPADGALYARGNAGQMITIAALGATPPRPLLSVRCDNNITHLALMLPQSLAAERVRLTLATDQGDDKQLWRVRDAGFVVSGGRGLPAIRTIKAVLGTPRIALQADQPELDGLVFDLANLRDALKPLRETCRW